MATLQDRGGSYRVLFQFAGRQHSLGLGRLAPKLAEARAARVDELLTLVKNGYLEVAPGDAVVEFLKRDGRPPAPPAVASVPEPPARPKLALASLQRLYAAAHRGSLAANSLGEIETHFKHLRETLGDDFVVEALELADLQRHVKRRELMKNSRGKPISPVTIQKDLVSLRVAWRWAAEGKLLAGAFPRLKSVRFGRTAEKPTMVDIQPKACAGRVRFAPREVDVRYRADGSILMRSPIPLDGCERHICAYLERWARQTPEQTFLAKREADGEWRRLTYSEAWHRARAIGQALLEHGLGPDRPLAILTGNSIEHAVIAFGAMTASVPVAPISPSYSASEGGLKRLAEIIDMLKPGMIFAQSADALAGARALPQLAELPWVSAVPAASTIVLAEIEAVDRHDSVDRAYAAAGHATVAKILFTSGSTGTPKGVPNTQGMLCSATRASGLMFPVDAPPVMVDWMPWHHTLGGNSTLHSILRDGGTMYIDDGRPLPGLFHHTIRNLTEIATTVVQNVPAGYQMLVPAMEADDALRVRFFERVERIAFAGASLSPDTFRRMQDLAIRTTGAPVPFIAGYGTTETSPGISSTHWPSEGKGEVGLPFPGCELKLVPFGDRYDIRARGPNVFPGYLSRPDLTAAAFDEEGFYRVGDAVQFMNPADPPLGLRFAGRLSENFKLSSGTWVLTGELRSEIIAAAPSIAEAVIAGHDRDDVRLLVWIAPSLLADLKRQEGVGLGAIAAKVVERIRDELVAYNKQNAGGTRRVAAFRIVSEPASMAAGEITDKGYVNQRAVLANRSELVEGLYTAAADVIVC